MVDAAKSAIRSTMLRSWGKAIEICVTVVSRRPSAGMRESANVGEALAKKYVYLFVDAICGIQKLIFVPWRLRTFAVHLRAWMVPSAARIRSLMELGLNVSVYFYIIIHFIHFICSFGHSHAVA